MLQPRWAEVPRDAVPDRVFGVCRQGRRGVREVHRRQQDPASLPRRLQVRRQPPQGVRGPAAQPQALFLCDFRGFLGQYWHLEMCFLSTL